MCIFFNLTIKSPEQPRWFNSAAFIDSSNHALRIAYCWLWRPYCICLQKNSIGKRPKDFESSGFPCCILNKYSLFLKPITEIKKISWCQKKRRCQQTKWHMQKVPFLWLGSYIPSFRTIACVVDKQSGIRRRYLLFSD